MKDVLYDVAVIGGGPAGSSFAIQAVRNGLRVIVLEKEKFPRDHVGESLIPFTYWRLKELGVLDKIQAFATLKPGVNFVDTDGIRQSTWCFGKVLKDDSQVTFHTLRAPFDKALLDHARETGAEVFEEHKVKEAELRDASGNVVLKVENKNGEQFQVKAKFLVDASGQSSFLAKKLGDKTAYEGLNRVAFFTHWTGTTYDKALQQGLIKIIYLKGAKKGWIWVIPVGRNHLSVGFSLSNEYVREQKAKLTEAGSKNWAHDLYSQELKYATHLDSILKDAKMEHAVNCVGDYSYYVEKKYGDNYVMIGDAGAFLDPIFSSGIYVALETGIRMANSIAVQLQQGAEEGKKRFEKEFTHIDGGYKLIEKFVRLFYTPEVLNFAHVNPSNEESYDASLKAYNVFHYLLSGDFFENYKLYNEFLDSINSNKAYERFIHFVQTRANETDLNQECGYSYEEIYGHLPPGDRFAEVKALSS